MRGYPRPLQLNTDEDQPADRQHPGVVSRCKGMQIFGIGHHWTCIGLGIALVRFN